MHVHNDFFSDIYPPTTLATHLLCAFSISTWLKTVLGRDYFPIQVNLAISGSWLFGPWADFMYRRES